MAKVDPVLRLISSGIAPFSCAAILLMATVSILTDAPRLAGIAATGDESVRLRFLQRQSGVHCFYQIKDELACTGIADLTHRCEELRWQQAGSVFTAPTLSGSERLRNAVGVNRVSLASPSMHVDGPFSLHVVFRHRGEGIVWGANSDKSGSLVALGDGVYSGFGVSLSVPEYELTFHMGCPRGTQAFSIRCTRMIPPEAWTHMTATWDGRVVKLFINGFAAGEKPFTGPFVQPRRYQSLRVGPVGNGLSSVNFDFEMLAITDRSLEPAEILGLIYSPGVDRTKEIQEFLSDAGPSSFGTQGRPLDDMKTMSRLSSLAGPFARENEGDGDPDLISLCQQLAARNSWMFPWATSVLQLGKSNCLEPAERIDHSLLGTKCQDADRAYLVAVREQQMNAWLSRYERQISSILKANCLECHHSGQSVLADFAQGLSLDDAKMIGAPFWRELGQVIEDGRMPPADHGVLTEEDRALVLRWVRDLPTAGMCEEIASDQTERWYDAEASLRHLTRFEFSNSIDDLLGIELDSALLPVADPSGGEGFDNSASVLFTSPAHIESWMNCVLHAVQQAATLYRDNEEFRHTHQDFPAMRFLSSSGQPSHDELSSLVDLIWRREPTEEQLQELLGIAESFAAEDASEWRSSMLQYLLISPNFLIVSEDMGSAPGVVRIRAAELATRMALFLWSSVPDAHCLEFAGRTGLRSRSDTRELLRYMLADPRAERLGESFGNQWLGLDNFIAEDVVSQSTEAGSAEVRRALKQQAARLVASVFRDGASLQKLISTDQLDMNSLLLEFEGVDAADDGVDTGSGWRTVAAPPHRRGGVLTLGAVLAANSYPDRTSPVLRGQWILDRLLGDAVPPPPPDVPVLMPAEKEKNSESSLREQLRLHSADESCSVCHEVMDQLGFCLDGYDRFGRYREGRSESDLGGILPNGQEIHGVGGLQEFLLSDFDRVSRIITRQMLGFALGRRLSRFDDCIVQRICDRLRNEDYRADIVIEEAVLSAPFRSRFFPDHE